MAYKCSICGITDVVHPGDICSLCADPFAHPENVVHVPEQQEGIVPKTYSNPKKRNILLNGGNAVNTGIVIPTTYSVVSDKDSSQGNVAVQTSANIGNAVSSPVAVPVRHKAAASAPVAVGITKNVNTDKIERGFLFKWFRSVFTKIPFTFDNDVTIFQVFPDYSGQSLNQSGYACDQVIVYGQVPVGFISENNDVEVFGYRNFKGNIIASEIRNTASGTTVRPQWSFRASVVKAITMFLLATVVALIVVGSVSASAKTTLIQVASVLLVIAIIVFLIKHPRVSAAVFAVISGFVTIIFNIIVGIFKAIFRTGNGRENR